MNAAATMNNPSPALSLQTALVKGKVKLALYYKVIYEVEPAYQLLLSIITESPHPSILCRTTA